MPLHLTCSLCGAPYTTIPSRLAAGKGKFCSRKCYFASQPARRRAPGAGAKRFTVEQFWAAFWTKNQPNGECLDWTGKRSSHTPGKGGPRGLVKVQSKWRYAHQMALEWKLGRPIAPGMQANHTCDRAICVNPDHLYEGTQQQNVKDRVERGRSRHALGESHSAAKLTEAQVREIRELASLGAVQQDLADQYGVSNQLISSIVRGKLWRHVE